MTDANVPKRSAHDFSSGPPASVVHRVMSSTKKSAEKIFAETFRKALQPKTVRRVRAKSEADVWYEQMKKDFVANGADHLKAARAKMGDSE